MSDVEAVTAQVCRLIAQGPLRRVREGLGGSHTVVTYPPLDAVETVEASPVEIGPVDQGLNLYMHIAFCEYICPFCHYAKTYTGIGQDTDQVVAYMQALSTEIEIRKKQIGASPIGSVYVGGGTPTSLSIRLLNSLVADIVKICGGQPANFCVETSPLTAATPEGRKKLLLLRDAGVNRFSIGVQSFDDGILQRLRGHNRSTVISAIEHLKASGADLNIDLIQDLPHQTPQSIDDDLACIDRYRPQQVTWYMLRFHDEASWHKAFSRGDLQGIPGDVESAVRRIEINRAMIGLGYVARPGGRYVLSPKTYDLYKEVRGGTEKPLLGFGVSAYSHGWGWFFRNVTARSGKSGITEYVRRMRAGESPIAYAFELTPEERAAGRFVTSVRDVVDPAWLNDGSAMARSAAATVRQLIELGALITNSDGKYILSEAGFAFEEEIATLFYSPAVQKLLSEHGDFWMGSPRSLPISVKDVEPVALSANR